MYRRLCRALCAAIVLWLVSCAALGAVAESIEVLLNTATRVYSSLDASARSVKVPKGLQVTLKSYSKGWGKVTYKGNTGYVRLKYLDRVHPLKAYVTRSATVYRSASEARSLTTVSTGTMVYVLGVDGSYVRIINNAGKWSGYIKAGVLSASKPSTPAKSSSGGSLSAIPEKLRATADGAQHSRIEMCIFVAQALIGAPHSDDPNPPESFDTARYTAYCYGKAGVDLSNSPKNQGNDSRYDKIADTDSLKRGDLVCFNTVEDSDLSDHVGIYLGDGYFLHASSVARQVIVSQLKSGYYLRVFSWGRRIFTS